MGPEQDKRPTDADLSLRETANGHNIASGLKKIYEYTISINPFFIKLQRIRRCRENDLYPDF